MEEAAQVLIVTLDYDTSTSSSPSVDGTTTGTAMDDVDVSYTRFLSHPCSLSLVSLQQIFFLGLSDAASSLPRASLDSHLCLVPARTLFLISYSAGVWMGNAGE